MFDGLTTEQKIDKILLILTGADDNAPQLAGGWLSEPQAAKELGYSPRTLRRKCKSNQLLIKWRVKKSGRGFEYSLKSILKYKEDTSSE